MGDKKKENGYPKIPEEYRIEYISRPAHEQKERDQNSYKLGYSESLKLWWHWKGKYLSIFIFIVGIIVLGIWYSNSNESVNTFTNNNVKTGVEVKNFPALEGPKTITFQWEYKDKSYAITETLYKTVYSYYSSSPEKHCWFKEEENYEICLKEFLEEAEEDNTISKIVSDIKAVASKNGLRGDELLELTVAFVQSIPYDWDKAEFIISLPGFYYDISELEPAYPRCPYEVLYDNEGICGGKSFLAASLIKELGYGVALFDYDPLIEGDIGHIAPAVKCPKRYSSYNSGYCHTEATEKGFNIGDMPIGFDTGIPRTRTTINLFEGENVFDLNELKDAKIYVIADGNSYQGIIDTVQIIQKIEILESEITRLYWVIISLDEEVNQLENSVNYYDQQSEAAYRRHELLGDYASYNEYNKLFSQYESAYVKLESKINEYNRKVDQYNNLAYQYNVLIEDFYK